MKPPLINDLPEPTRSGVCDFHAQPLPPRKASENPMEPAMGKVYCPDCHAIYVPECPYCREAKE